jgi:hypothetical protein
VFIGEATVDNLWVMKAILHGFEFVSGLKVNFWKSCFVGVNVEVDFLVMASRFLNCRIGGLRSSILAFRWGLIHVVWQLGNPCSMSLRIGLILGEISMLALAGGCAS